MKKIAIVDDWADDRLLARVLLDERYEVLEYASGEEALARLPQDQPDLILLDIGLPGLSGFEVLKRIRSHPELRDIPVVAYTAAGTADDRSRFLAAGFEELIGKPVLDELEMLAAVGRISGQPAPWG